LPEGVLVLYIAVLLLTPIIIMMGLAPDLEAALYFTVVVLVLLWAAFALMGLVFAPRRPETA
jgi:hypothetical protein